MDSGEGREREGERLREEEKDLKRETREREIEKAMMLETKGDIGWEVRLIELVKCRYR